MQNSDTAGQDYPLRTDLNLLKIPPFKLKDHLHTLAQRAVVQGLIPSALSVARGDPSYPASLHAHQVYEFLLGFAVRLLEFQSATANKMPDSSLVARAWNMQQEYTAQAPHIITMVEGVLSSLLHTARISGLSTSRDMLLATLARQITGCGYGNPQGEPIVRAILAQRLNQCVFDLPEATAITYETVVMTEGAGGAIGAIINALRATGYLRSGDYVAMIAPLYAPYQEICEQYGLRLVLLYCSAEHGNQPTASDRANFAATCQRTPFKLLIAVDPSNPTGRILSPETVAWLALLVRQYQTPVLLDVVYQELLDAPTSVYTFLHAIPDQTLVVYSLSKAYCQTGSRVGAVAYTPDAARWISERVGCSIPWEQSLIAAKDASGGPTAHVTMVPLSQQWRAALHLIIGDTHLMQWRAELRRRYIAFHQALGLIVPSGIGQTLIPYYLVVPLDTLVAQWAIDIPIYHSLLHHMKAGVVTPGLVLETLANAGVELLYAARFYPEREREHQWMVRMSVANQPVEALCEVADRIRQTLHTLAETLARRQAA